MIYRNSCAFAAASRVGSWSQGSFACRDLANMRTGAGASAL